MDFLVSQQRIDCQLTPTTIITVNLVIVSKYRSLYGDSFRTIQAFSTEAEEKLSGEKWFDVYQHYWGAPDYADQFTSAACTGTGSYATVEPVVRAEACTKGAQ